MSPPGACFPRQFQSIWLSHDFSAGRGRPYLRRRTARHQTADRGVLRTLCRGTRPVLAEIPLRAVPLAHDDSLLGNGPALSAADASVVFGLRALFHASDRNVHSSLPRQRRPETAVRQRSRRRTRVRLPSTLRFCPGHRRGDDARARSVGAPHPPGAECSGKGRSGARVLW